ncbi:uncharacterized protein LOC119553533 [Drosophila subpulchrella]|uniref:uncharacterized protein LOC119553533 n=1 Tax=Drosophila subpulchrella TaxID=1486046 RepID=UPI0018A1AEC1|nr:uncharacterized protein LOC119553533 [Drosophila subpulchrella]
MTALCSSSGKVFRESLKSAEWSRVSGVAECESEALANVDEDVAAVPEDVGRCAVLWAWVSMGTEELKVRRAERASGEFIAQGSISWRDVSRGSECLRGGCNMSQSCRSRD